MIDRQTERLAGSLIQTRYAQVLISLKLPSTQTECPKEDSFRKETDITGPLSMKYENSWNGTLEIITVMTPTAK
jgi:hypothetical protein